MTGSLLSRALAQPKTFGSRFRKNATPIGLCMSQDPVVVGSKSRNEEPSHEKIISLRKVVNPLLKSKTTLHFTIVHCTVVHWTIVSLTIIPLYNCPGATAFWFFKIKLEASSKLYALGFGHFFAERWNQLDMFIVLLSIAGIIFEEFEALELPINPTIIRVMRVLRIARGCF